MPSTKYQTCLFFQNEWPLTTSSQSKTLSSFSFSIDKIYWDIQPLKCQSFLKVHNPEQTPISLDPQSAKSLNQNLNPVIGSNTHLMKCHMIAMVYVQSVQGVIKPTCSTVDILLMDTLAVRYWRR